MVAQLLLNSYLGSRLSAESDGISYAIYESQWVDRSEKCKRAIRILIERSRRPMTIYAGGLFELSLATFVKVSSTFVYQSIFNLSNSIVSLQICRAAYSYFNVLRSMDSKMA